MVRSGNLLACAQLGFQTPAKACHGAGDRPNAHANGTDDTVDNRGPLCSAEAQGTTSGGAYAISH